MSASPSIPECGVIDIDARGVVVGANERLLEWIDRDLGDIVGQPMSYVLELRLPEAGVAGLPADASLRHRSGTIRAVAVGSLGPHPEGLSRIVVYDLSDGSQFQRAFQVGDRRSRRGQQRLEILLGASVGFAEARTEEAAAELLSVVARRAFAASSVSVHLQRDGEVGHIAGENPLAAHWPTGAPPTGARTRIGREVIVVRSPEDAVQYNPHVPIDGVFRSAGIQAALASPIAYEGDALGSMICYFDHPREFDEEAVPLAEALANQAGQAIARIRLEETVRRNAMLDAVTGLPNRRLFEEDLASIVPDADKLVAVLFIDLDGFKSVNDRLGHPTGDRLLRQVGERLAAQVRDLDAIGRYGGDEFVAIAVVADDGGATALADRIRRVIAEPYPGIPRDIPIAASIGVVVGVQDPRQPLVADQMIRAADHAMYDAKTAGGNQVVVVPFA